MPPSPPPALNEGLHLISAPREGMRPASFWRFEGAPPPGTGRTPMAAVAGLGLDGRAFRRFAPLARDRDLVLVNLRNDVSRGHPAMEDLAHEVLTTLEAAGHGGRPAILAGSSMGGMVSLAAAVEAPARAAGLVLLGTGAAWSSLPARVHATTRLHPFIPRRWYPRVFASLMLPPARYPDPEVREELRTQMLHRDKEFIGTTLEAMRRFDIRSRLPAVKVPALVIHGERDRVIPPAAGRELADGLPRREWLTLPGCGHLPHVSHADATVEAIARFLEKESL